MTMLASQITSLTVVYSFVYSGVNQRKHQSSASLAFVREIHRGPVNFPHKWPVTRKMFPFDDVIMQSRVHHGIHKGTMMARLSAQQDLALMDFVVAIMSILRWVGLERRTAPCNFSWCPGIVFGVWRFGMLGCRQFVEASYFCELID